MPLPTPINSPSRSWPRRAIAVGLVTLVSMACGTMPAAAGGGTTELVSRPAAGLADDYSNLSNISDDGTVVAFSSKATNLVKGKSKIFQIYARVKTTGNVVTVEKVSVATDGTESNSTDNVVLAISATGRFIVFQSGATNLVPGDTNGLKDVFMRDRLRGITRRVNVSSSGAQKASGINWTYQQADVSFDGKFVVFTDDAPNLAPVANDNTRNVFRRDTVEGKTSLVSAGLGNAKGNAASVEPQMSADGNIVAFTSTASNMVSGDGNGRTDVFVRNISAGTTQMVSKGLGGAQANAASSDVSIDSAGTKVMFLSFASNLVAGDSNGDHDTFVRTVGVNPQTSRVSLDSADKQLLGRVDEARMSADGKTVVFLTEAAGVIPGQAGCKCAYRRGITAGGAKTSVAALKSDGKPASDLAFPNDVWVGRRLDVNASGTMVTFSAGDGVVPGDNNTVRDVFVRNTLP
ncbi:MAG: TolB-like protein [Acidimicrobiales bacterium]|nr:TolB-like protein [Acidimicrobiales bacterium]